MAKKSDDLTWNDPNVALVKNDVYKLDGKRTDNSILQEFYIKLELHGHVRKRKLSCTLEPLQSAEIMAASSRMVRGRKAKMREATKTIHIDNIKQWT